MAASAYTATPHQAPLRISTTSEDANTQRSFGGLRWRITAEIGIVRRPELVNDISMIRYRIVPDSLSAFGVEVEPAGRVPVSARLRQRPPDDKRVALCVVVGGGRDSEL
jgi:hypothetical protein